MSGLFAGTPLERPVTCEVCEQPRDACTCPRDADGRVLLPSGQPVRVRLVKRRKGKTVTLITGLDATASDLPGILKQLKKTCSAGGTVSEEGVEIQGDHREKAVAVLRDRGYPVDGAP